jgi:sec-independent protein translocase protein TatB
MFDISWQELALIAIVALLVIPPKDLPRAMATAGKWMRYAKGLVRDFHNGIDELAREAELAELRRTAAEAAKKVSAPVTLENLMADTKRVEPPIAIPPAPPTIDHE